MEDGVDQHASFPEVVAHVLQPAGIQAAHRLAVGGDPQRDGDRVVLPALLAAPRLVEKGEDLHFCWGGQRGWGDRVSTVVKTASSGPVGSLSSLKQ